MRTYKCLLNINKAIAVKILKLKLFMELFNISQKLAMLAHIRMGKQALSRTSVILTTTTHGI